MSLFAFSMQSREVLKLRATELDKLDIFYFLGGIYCNTHTNEYTTDRAANYLSFIEKQRQTLILKTETELGHD